MKLKVINAFNWAHRGVQIEEFSAGDVIDTEDDDLIEVSLQEGWTEKLADADGDGRLTVSEIKAQLDELGIEYPAGAKKADLLALLEG